MHEIELSGVCFSWIQFKFRQTHTRSDLVLSLTTTRQPNIEYFLINSKKVYFSKNEDTGQIDRNARCDKSQWHRQLRCSSLANQMKSPSTLLTVFMRALRVKTDVQKLKFYNFSKNSIGLDHRKENFYRALSHLTYLIFMLLVVSHILMEALFTSSSRLSFIFWLFLCQGCT